jgi:PIN domain nuclease of toxin-antitoxin system
LNWATCGLGLSMAWTRDSFDSLIVANAKYEKAYLLTKDDNIQKNFKQAIW